MVKYILFIPISVILIFGCSQNYSSKKRILYKNKDGDIVRIDSVIGDIMKSSVSFYNYDNSNFYRLTLFDKNQNIIEESDFYDKVIRSRSLFAYEGNKLVFQRGFKYENGAIQDSFELTYQYLRKKNGHLCKITNLATKEIVRLVDFAIDSINFWSITRTYLPKDSLLQLVESEISQFDKNWNEINTLVKNVEQETNSFTMNQYDTINRITFDMVLINKKLVKCRIYRYKDDVLSEVSIFDEKLNNSKLNLFEEKY